MAGIKKKSFWHRARGDQRQETRGARQREHTYYVPRLFLYSSYFFPIRTLKHQSYYLYFCIQEKWMFIDVRRLLKIWQLIIGFGIWIWVYPYIPRQWLILKRSATNTEWLINHSGRKDGAEYVEPFSLIYHPHFSLLRSSEPEYLLIVIMHYGLLFWGGQNLIQYLNWSFNCIKYKTLNIRRMHLKYHLDASMKLTYSSYRSLIQSAKINYASQCLL